MLYKITDTASKKVYETEAAKPKKAVEKFYSDVRRTDGGNIVVCSTRGTYCYEGRVK